MDDTYALSFALDAQKDLEAAVQWIKEDSAEAAQAFFLNLRTKCETNLTFTPHMGVRLRLLDGTELYALTCSQYRVFYVADDVKREVTVIRILHTSRNISRLLNTGSE